MPDREKVMTWLEICGENRDCSATCPYGDGSGEDEDSRCRENLMADALVLLKEQEARLMTLNEVKAFDWDYCYLEEERLPWEEYRIVCGDYALSCITWVYVASMRIQYGDNSYGKKWRCWSAKPTEEQRQAVKWE